MSISEHWKETLATEFSDDNMYVHIDQAIDKDYMKMKKAKDVTILPTFNEEDV